VTSRSGWDALFPLALIGALVLMILGLLRPAHGEDPPDDPPECIDDWPNPDSCFPDILCDEYADFWDVRRAVVHIYGPDIAGTGVLINNAQCDAAGEQCGKPYLLTAYHVGSGGMGEEMTNGQRIAIQDEAMFTFGLEAVTCGGPTAGVAVAFKGAWIMEESVVRDVLLLQLKTDLPPELGAYFVGWGKGPLDQAVAIGHPCGAPKRIAISWPGFVTLKQVVGKTIYDVEYWEDGALAAGSSGSPLLDVDTGSLRGVFTNAWGQGPRTCFHPDQKAHDFFTALPSILDTLPEAVDGNRSFIDAYDSKPNDPSAGTVEDGNYYGKGEIEYISATEQVLLVPNFHADKGSTITIEIKP
jgi:hypothetical protein